MHQVWRAVYPGSCIHSNSRYGAPSVEDVTRGSGYGGQAVDGTLLWARVKDLNLVECSDVYTLHKVLVACDDVLNVLCANFVVLYHTRDHELLDFKGHGC